MAETIIETPVCEKCGADVRENTQFCYNCGSSVTPSESADAEAGVTTVSEDTQAALDDLSARFKIEEPSEDKLARAAEERKRARVERRKPKDYTWEPVEETSAIRLLVVALIIAAIVGLAVVFGVWWR